MPLASGDPLTAAGRAHRFHAAVVLSQAVPRAHLAWRLELGCISDDVIAKMSPREAAASVDVIAHVRVTSVDGPVLFSTRPGCEGKIRQSYAATVLQATNGAASGNRNPIQLLLRPSDRKLNAGGESSSCCGRAAFQMTA